MPITPVVRIKPTGLPKFSGIKRDFFRWKTDWEGLQRQGKPTGSVEVKKIHGRNALDVMRLIPTAETHFYAKIETAENKMCLIIIIFSVREEDP